MSARGQKYVLDATDVLASGVVTVDNKSNLETGNLFDDLEIDSGSEKSGNFTERKFYNNASTETIDWQALTLSGNWSVSGDLEITGTVTAVSGLGVTTLLGLTDTPVGFGTVGQVLKVNAGATAVEWADDSNIGTTTLLGLTDTPAGFGTAGQVLKVNAGATAVEWADDDTGAVGSVAMDDLTDADTVSSAPGVGDHLKWDGNNWVPDSSAVSHTHTLLNLTDTPGAIGTAGQVLKVNAGATAVEWGTDNEGATDVWESKSAAFNVVAGTSYFIDTSGGAFTATLPTTPSQGDEVRFIDATGDFSSFNLTIGRNSENIQGVASDMTVAISRAGFALVYYDATQGWILKDK